MANLSQAADTFDKFFGDPELDEHRPRSPHHDERRPRRRQEVQSPIDAIDRNLKNLEGLTEPLGRNGEQVAHSLIDGLNGLSADRRRTDRADRSAQQPRRHDRPTDPRPGSLRQPQPLLCNSNHVVLRINDLAMRLRPDPRRCPRLQRQDRPRTGPHRRRGVRQRAGDQITGCFVLGH